MGDEPLRVQQNRDFLVNELQLPSAPVWLNQRHSNVAVSIDRGEPGMPADAAVTRRGGRICAVLTADCLPILLCDTDGTRVAAIHAGWRGMAAGIIESAFAALRPAGRRLLAWLGAARTLVIMPLFTLAGFIALALFPQVLVLGVFQALR